MLVKAPADDSLSCSGTQLRPYGERLTGVRISASSSMIDTSHSSPDRYPLAYGLSQLCELPKHIAHDIPPPPKYPMALPG